MELTAITSSRYYIAYKDVGLFVLITLSFHFFFRAIAPWLYNIAAWQQVSLFLQNLLFENAVWLIRNVLKFDIVTGDLKISFVDNHGYLAVTESFASLKIFLQFIVLMVLFPGAWKHKLWYIPAGIVVLHLTNIFRIVGLSRITISLPRYWHYSDEYFFRPLFYVVIFTMWVIWVENFYRKNNSII
jgi:exosortase/archaeosortase family protein